METETDAAAIRASLDDPERFGVVFDRHATVLFRYLVRRVGVDEADPLLGEVFRVAFERRATYDCDRPNARPWLYGIATKLLAHHRRSEARRLRAMGRLLADQGTTEAGEDRATAVLDAEKLWPSVARAVADLPDAERDTMVLYVWEELSYEQISTALDVPVGTVRSRLNRSRQRMRELDAARGRQVHE